MPDTTELSLVVFGHDKIPPIEAILAAVSDDFTRGKAPVFVRIAQQMASSATVDAIDFGGDLLNGHRKCFLYSWTNYIVAVRVVAGSARGRRIAVPAGRTVRPTTDRVREATFNALGSLSCVAEAEVLDLFAGSGALGIEALSRGANGVTFVELDRVARNCVAANVHELGFDDPIRVHIHAGSAHDFLRSVTGTKFDLIFADPPYAFDDWPELLAMIDAVGTSSAVIVAESDREVSARDGWKITRSKRYGGTVVTIHVRTVEEPQSFGAST